MSITLGDVAIIAILIMLVLLLSGQSKILNKIPTTTNCEMVGLGKTKATIINPPKNMIVIQCHGRVE